MLITQQKKDFEVWDGATDYRAVQLVGRGPPGQLGGAMKTAAGLRATAGEHHRVVIWITPGGVLPGGGYRGAGLWGWLCACPVSFSNPNRRAFWLASNLVWLCAEEACLGLGGFYYLWTLGSFWLWVISSRCEILPI